MWLKIWLKWLKDLACIFRLLRGLSLLNEAVQRYHADPQIRAAREPKRLDLALLNQQMHLVRVVVAKNGGGFPDGVRRISSSGSTRSSGSSYTPKAARPPKPRPTPAPLLSQFTGKVVPVTDGETLTVQLASKRRVKIRLHGIDAPEKAQSFGPKSRQSLIDFSYGKLVEVQRQGVSKEGLLVGVVTPHGASSSANARQLKEGMAWWHQKAARRGLWSEGNPTSP